MEREIQPFSLQTKNRESVNMNKLKFYKNSQSTKGSKKYPKRKRGKRQIYGREENAWKHGTLAMVKGDTAVEVFFKTADGNKQEQRKKYYQLAFIGLVGHWLKASHFGAPTEIVQRNSQRWLGVHRACSSKWRLALRLSGHRVPWRERKNGSIFQRGSSTAAAARLIPGSTLSRTALWRVLRTDFDAVRLRKRKMLQNKDNMQWSSSETAQSGAQTLCKEAWANLERAAVVIFIVGRSLI